MKYLILFVLIILSASFAFGEKDFLIDNINEPYYHFYFLSELHESDKQYFVDSIENNKNIPINELIKRFSTNHKYLNDCYYTDDPYDNRINSAVFYFKSEPESLISIEIILHRNLKHDKTSKESIREYFGNQTNYVAYFTVFIYQDYLNSLINLSNEANRHRLIYKEIELLQAIEVGYPEKKVLIDSLVKALR